MLTRTPPSKPASEVLASSAPIGLMAGWGRYPIVVADALRQQGRRVVCLGIRDHADPALADHCDEFDWVGLARIGSAIRFYRRRGVASAVMAGKVHKVDLYRPGAWLKYFPDWRTVRTFYPHFIRSKADRKDDTLLGAIVDAFAAGGVTFAPATHFAPELLVKTGCLTRREPTASERKDIEFGWQLAKEMGRLDVGQSVVVKNRTPLAIEAIEGTDQCIRRAGELCQSGGFTVVKVAKPRQDMRFDVPTIGLGTLESMVAAGGRVLAVEAGRTILIDQPQVVAYAELHGLTVIAFDEPDAPAA